MGQKIIQLYNYKGMEVIEGHFIIDIYIKTNFYSIYRGI